MTSILPIGTIVAFAINSNNIPDGWLVCDGSPIPSKYEELIALLGSNNTPDLRGRTLIGAGTPLNVAQSDGSLPNFPGSPFALGTNGGEYAHTLDGSELPPHTHTLDDQHDSESGSSDGFLTPPASTGEAVYDTSKSVAAHNTMQPYYVIYYIIYAAG